MDKSSQNISSILEPSFTVLQEFKELSLKYKCVSLAEGAPVLNPPSYLVDEMIKAIKDGHN
jgi:hypothetical protein